MSGTATPSPSTSALQDGWKFVGHHVGAGADVSSGTRPPSASNDIQAAAPLRDPHAARIGVEILEVVPPPLHRSVNSS